MKQKDSLKQQRLRRALGTCMMQGNTSLAYQHQKQLLPSMGKVQAAQQKLRREARTFLVQTRLNWFKSLLGFACMRRGHGISYHNAFELHHLSVNSKTSVARTQNEDGHERRGATKGVHNSAAGIVHVSKHA
jgi:hypothetical protein